ncbi:MAG: hypothetical protein AAB373_05540 [Patescibacteria group bacterium]
MTTAPKIRPSEAPNSENLSTEQKVVERTDAGKSQEIRDAADVGRGAYVEAVGLDEAAETTGKISEIMSDKREDSGSGGSVVKSGGTVAIDPKEIKLKLLENLPPEKIMKKEIEKEVKKEIDYLHKKAMSMLRSPSKMSYFEMANLMKKIRELKGVLLMIFKASIDGLKNLWLRYVHGIM